MADLSMLMDGMEMQKNDFVGDTIGMGIISLAELITPTLLWWLVVKKQPRMVNGFDAATNDWYYVSWYSMWTGNLLAYIAPFLLWIPSYFNDTVARAYGFAWMFAAGIGGLNTVFVWTALLVSGIEWPDFKDVWISFVLFTIIQMVMGKAGMDMAKGAKIYYLWNAMEKKCEKDAEGKCVWPEGEDPATALNWDKEEDWDY